MSQVSWRLPAFVALASIHLSAWGQNAVVEPPEPADAPQIEAETPEVAEDLKRPIIERVITEPLSGPELLAELGEIQNLQGRQRYVDALMRLEQLEKFHPDIADLYNIRGSIYLAPSIRNFDGAEEQFLKAKELSKGQLAPEFNLAELHFVKHDWEEAQKRFDRIAKDYPKLQLAVAHLVHYKRVICHLMTGNQARAEVIIQENFTFMDDTPAYYFSNAAVAFSEDDKSKAQEWLAKANTIFGAQICLPYLDGLMEARWVPNIGLPPVEGAASE